MLRWMRWLVGGTGPTSTPEEKRFYAAARRLDLSLFEDERFVRDRPCARLGEIMLDENGRIALSTHDLEVRRRYRRAVRSGRLELPVGGFRNGGRWDGEEILDARRAHNILLWLCAWNDVGVFAPATQAALTALFREYGIEPVVLER